MKTPDKPSKETLEHWNKDTNNWIWGCLYYNKEDKIIWVEKKVTRWKLRLTLLTEKRMVSPL